jgi:hypothetical protein
MEDWLSWFQQVGSCHRTESATESSSRKRSPMKATQFTGYGAAPVLNGVAEPTVGEDDVLVRVAGVALNPADVKSDFHPPPCGRLSGDGSSHHGT